MADNPTSSARAFDFYWLASFPRSGNTLIRQIAKAGWNIDSTSIYSDDLGGDALLEESCGHYDIARAGDRFSLRRGSLIKTHELPHTEGRAIYLVRDARAAYVSFYFFADKQYSMEDIIVGAIPLARWDRNLEQWTKSGRIDCLIRYEDIVDAPEHVAGQLEALFGPALNDPLTPLSRRNEFAARDGKWIRKHSNWQEFWNKHLDRLFWNTHAETFLRYYPDERPLF